MTSADIKQFRSTRLRFDLVGDVPLNWINAMGNCAVAGVPTVSFVSGTANVTFTGTGLPVSVTGAPLSFGPLAVPVPVEAGTVLATDAAGNVLQVVWPLLAGLPAGPPVLRLNMVQWSPAVATGGLLNATLTFVARGADGSTATFTATGTGMPVPVFVP